MSNGKPRPSALPHLEWCPRFVSRPDKKDEKKKDCMDLAAEEGTFLHAKMEELAAVPEAGWDDYILNMGLAPTQVPLIQSAAEQVRDLFKMGLPVVSKESLGILKNGHYALSAVPDIAIANGVYVETSVDPEITKPGTADLVAIMGTNAVLVDYKFTMVERDHDAQMLAYVLGLFEADSKIKSIENRIVAPRLRDVHKPHNFEKDRDYENIRTLLTQIVGKASDPFEPGCPGVPCAVCSGNGRCPWQMASLKNIPADETGVMLTEAWKPILLAGSIETRAMRRKLYSWLGKMLESIKEDDKQWALAHPDITLPGFKRTSRLGNLRLDKDRSPEICQRFCDEFDTNLNQLTEMLDLNMGRAAEFVAMNTGITEPAAKKRIQEILAPYMTRGCDIVYFRGIKAKKVPAEITEEPLAPR